MLQFEELPDMTIETTLGELICAIRDAALEAQIEETDVAELTELVLNDLLTRYAG